MPLSPFSFCNNLTTSPTSSSNIFAEIASSFENISKPVQSVRALPPREASPVTASDNLPNLAALSMDVRGLHYPQRPWEMEFQAEALSVDHENLTWPDLNCKDTGFSSNRSFFDFTAFPIPPPTIYAIQSPWPSEIYNWTISDKLSPPASFPLLEGVNEEAFQSTSASTPSVSMPEWIQKHQDNIDPKDCDRGVPGNGFSTKSNCAAHYPRNAPTNEVKLDSHLKCHLQNYHDEALPFLCNTIAADATVCEARFSAIKLLQAHRRRVHRAKSHLCTKEGCSRNNSGNGFKLKSHLRRHLQTHLAN